MPSAVGRPNLERMKKIGAAIVLAAMFAGVGATSVLATGPTVWYVDDDGMAGSNGCNGSQSVPSVIQDGVDLASPGDTVKVCPGTYVGTVDVATEGLRLTATEAWAAIIKAPSDVGPALVTLRDASHIDLHWFSIIAGTTAPCATPTSLVSVSNAPDAHVRGNHLGLDGAEATDCRSFVVGINLSNSPSSFVGWNRVTDFSGVGIQEFGSPDTHIRANTVLFLHAALACCAYSDSVGILTAGFATVVRGNVVRALATAGDTTPVLQVGINFFGDNNFAWRNKVRYANFGIQTINTDGVSIKENRLRGIRVYGIVLSGATDAGVWGNYVRAQYEGIHVNSSATLNDIFQNDFRGPSDPDCLDQSSGGGTSGTANSWTDNLGDTASPAGICTPAP